MTSANVKIDAQVQSFFNSKSKPKNEIKIYLGEDDNSKLCIEILLESNDENNATYIVLDKFRSEIFIQTLQTFYKLL
jgi:hypothetical protein